MSNNIENAFSEARFPKMLYGTSQLHLDITAYCLEVLPNQAFLRGRDYSQSAEPNLKNTLRSVIPEKRELLKKVKRHADKRIGDVKVENTIGGMR